MTRIGIDVQSTKGRLTGLGTYTHHLTQALLEMPANGVEFRLYSRKSADPLNTLDRWRWENFELPRLARRDRAKLVHVPAFAPPFLKPCKTLVTVHDLIGMIFPNQLNWPSRYYWGGWLPFAVRNADFLIADSESTKKDLINRLHVPGKKIRVIYPSGHEGFSSDLPPERLRELRERMGMPEKYFLCVGTLEPRKNIFRVIQAFRGFWENRRGEEWRLVIVGSQNFAHGKMFRRLLGETGIEAEKIIFTDYVSKTDLNVLYLGAQALIFPSLYEGFGIPILEAMACGTPVLTSRVSSLPEVAGDAAYFVDPLDTEAIGRGMAELSGDERLRSELKEKGFRQIKKFSWQETARQTLEVYKKFL